MLGRVRSRMEITYGIWEVLTAGDLVRPVELAIIFGMMDSIG